MRRFGLVVGLVLSIASASPAGGQGGDLPHLWPLFVYDVQEDTTEIEILSPLLRVKKTPEKDTWNVLLTAYKRNHKKSETVFDLVWPIWSVTRDDEGHFHSRIFPLFFGKGEDWNYGVLFPEFWWFIDAEDGDESTIVVLPFVHHREGDDERFTGLLPWWVSRKKDREFANLFPVLWEKDEDGFENLVAFPLYWQFDDQVVLFPLYWNLDEHFMVFPFYGHCKFGKWEVYGIMPPLYCRKIYDNDYVEHDSLWPIFSWGKGKTRKRFAMRPLYDYDKKGDYLQQSILLYLGAHGRGGGRKLDRFFPLFNFDRREDRHDTALLWPLYRDRLKFGSRARRILTLSPVGLYKLETPRKSWHALNLAWWGRSTGDDTTKGLVETHGFYPLYSFTENFYERERVQDVVTREFRLFDPLRPLDLPQFNISRTPLAIIPSLLTVREQNTGYRNWSLAYDLFDWTVRGGDQFNKQLILGTFFGFNWHRWENRGPEDEVPFRNRDLHILTIFWDFNRELHHSQGLWPLYTYKAKRKGGLNASFLDPLWFWGDATGEEEHVSAFMKIVDYRRRPNGDSRFSFIWRAFRREKSGDAVRTEMFPFLYLEKSPDASRFSFLWRVFQLEKRDGKRSVRILFSPKIGL